VVPDAVAGLVITLLAVPRINREVDITTTAQCVRFADETIVIQRDAVLVAWVELTGYQHQLKLFEHQGKA
jgi:hypothetical protein